MAARAEHERRGAAQQVRHLVARHRPEQLDRRGELPRLLLELGPGRARRPRSRAARAPGRRLDREVEPLLGRQPRPRRARSAPWWRARAVGHLLRGQVVGQHVEPVGGHAETSQLPGGPAAGRDEAVGRVERERLVQRQAGGVGDGLGHRLAAVEHQPRQRVARPRQRKQGAPSRAATPIAQNSRALWRWSTTRAPAARAAASPRGPISGCMLWAWTTSAPSSPPPRDPPPALPPRSSAAAARRRGESAERRSSRRCATPAFASARCCSATERSSPPSKR